MRHSILPYHVNFQHRSGEAFPRSDASFYPERSDLIDFQNVGHVLPLRQDGGVPLVDVDAKAQLVEDRAALGNLQNINLIVTLETIFYLTTGFHFFTSENGDTESYKNFWIIDSNLRKPE